MIDEKKLMKNIHEAINDGRYDGHKPATVLCEVLDMILEQPKEVAGKYKTAAYIAATAAIGLTMWVAGIYMGGM